MRNEILGKLQGPAIGLIITGVLNALLGAYLIISSIIQFLTGSFERSFSNEAEKIGFYVGFWGVALLGLIGLIIAPLIIIGGIKMLRGKSYGFVKAMAILAAIPFTSCCFVVGVPLGIWAVVVLRRPEVIALFDGDLPAGGFSPPPQPPGSF